MKSAALAVAFGSEANVGCGSDPGPCPAAGVRANAGRSLPAPVAIRLANPSRTKSLRLMRPSSVNFPVLSKDSGFGIEFLDDRPIQGNKDFARLSLWRQFGSPRIPLQNNCNGAPY